MPFFPPRPTDGTPLAGPLCCHLTQHASATIFEGPHPPQDGDIFLERSEGWVGQAIRWLTASDWNHAGLVFLITPDRAAKLRDFRVEVPKEWEGQWGLLEAVGQGVTVTLLRKRVDDASTCMLARRRGLTEEQRQVLVNAATDHAGQAYGYLMLMAFYLGIILYRQPSLRDAVTNRLPQAENVCSTLVALAFSALRIEFGGRYRSATPGKIATEILTHPDEWLIYLLEE